MADIGISRFLCRRERRKPTGSVRSDVHKPKGPGHGEAQPGREQSRGKVRLNGAPL